MFRAHIPFNLALHSFKATACSLNRMQHANAQVLPGGNLAWLFQWMSSFKCIFFLKLFTG